MILIETLTVAAIGIGVGLLGATALTKFLHSLLFGVTSHDLLTFVGSPLCLLVATITAAPDSCPQSLAIGIPLSTLR